MVLYHEDKFVDDHFFSEGLQLPLDSESYTMSNVTTSFDCEFGNMDASAGTTQMLIQDPYQQTLSIKPPFPPKINIDDLVKPKVTKPSKPPNAFIIYQPETVKQEYKKLAKDAENRYKEVWNSSSTPRKEPEILPLYMDPSIHSTSRANKIKSSQACSYCQKAKVKCNLLGNIQCKRCIERGLKCSFNPQQKRGPKPGKKTRLNMSNWAAFQRLDQDYTQKAHKLGFDVHRIVECSNNLDTLIPNCNTTLPMDVHPSPLPISSSDCEASNSSISIWTDNYQWNQWNNGSEIDPTLPSLYPNFHF
ncbi:34815_t:CDS:2 [Gigaspora margarita]|uniref:34815_t:CDS:1 n=1 Tax=Gigaspora margarita TaxID=4874 RepID=A0ABM8VZ80_GIGMA|nr:34815_t:CDS:2 [Gigaspora margarita]